MSENNDNLHYVEIFYSCKPEYHTENQKLSRQKTSKFYTYKHDNQNIS